MGCGHDRTGVKASSGDLLGSSPGQVEKNCGDVIFDNIYPYVYSLSLQDLRMTRSLKCIVLGDARFLSEMTPFLVKNYPPLL